MKIKELIASRRIGKMTIADVVFEFVDVEVVNEALEGGFVIDVKRDLENSCSVYTLYHTDFDQVEQGQKIPFYAMVATTDQDGIQSFIEFRKTV